jgi:hypothetical protein
MNSFLEPQTTEPDSSKSDASRGKHNNKVEVFECDAVWAGCSLFFQNLFLIYFRQ